MRLRPTARPDIQEVRQDGRFRPGCAAMINDSAASLTALAVGVIVLAMTSATAFVPPHNLEAERSVLGAILLTGRKPWN